MNAEPLHHNITTNHEPTLKDPTPSLDNKYLENRTTPPTHNEIHESRTTPQLPVNTRMRKYIRKPNEDQHLTKNFQTNALKISLTTTHITIY